MCVYVCTRICVCLGIQLAKARHQVGWLTLCREQWEEYDVGITVVNFIFLFLSLSS